MFALLLLFLPALLPAQIGRFGLPACSGPSRALAVKSAFIVCHDAHTKTPVWTAHEVTSATLAPEPFRRRHFRRDQSLEHTGASDADYRNSGWTRGHMVPAADVAGNEHALRESFLLSNAVPQDAALNRSLWRRLENEVRRRAESADSIVVFTGPVFCENPERIGEGHVAVPCELFKVVVEVRGRQTRAVAVIVPNAPPSARTWTSYAVPLEAVRQRTGLDLLPAFAESSEQAGTGGGQTPPPCRK